MQTGQLLSISPSFNSYSNSKLAEIAARVVKEFDGEEYNSEELYDEFYEKTEAECNFDSRKVEKNEIDGDGDGDEDEEFEFAFVPSDSEFSSSISADEIFYNGQIRAVFPIFNRDLFTGNSDSSSRAPARLPLRKLFVESDTMSSSSSEVDDLDGVPAGPYCEWRPKSPSTDDKERCKKSSSTGTITKRCTFKDLLHRSHSDGDQDKLELLTPSKQKENQKSEIAAEKPVVGGGKVKFSSPYARNGGDRRRTFLPYRKDLVGFFFV